jgi:hypothetical protein
MSTTQRSESFTSLCNGYLTPSTTLMQFAERVAEIEAERQKLSVIKQLENKKRDEDGECRIEWLR